MTLNISDIYQKIIPVKNIVQLSYDVPEPKQRDYIATLIDHITPEQDPKILLMITKLYIHFVTYGASPEVKDDAFTSMMILKSFSIKQNLAVMQELLFSFYFHLLYSRSLNSDQKHETMLEFSEFGHSDTTAILIRFLCFYFDTKANQDFNLFEHKESDISNETIANLCKAFLRITEEHINTFPALKPDSEALTLDTIQQRFYNQLVYGSWGLKRHPYDSNRIQILLNYLSKCAQTDLQSAKKALLKCIEFLYNQAQSAETNNKAEDLLLIHDDIQYAVTQINSVDFGKLTPQWDKLAKKIENKGY